jgi:hypothetical protein
MFQLCSIMLVKQHTFRWKMSLQRSIFMIYILHKLPFMFPLRLSCLTPQKQAVNIRFGVQQWQLRSDLFLSTNILLLCVAALDVGTENWKNRPFLELICKLNDFFDFRSTYLMSCQLICTKIAYINFIHILF